jgi:predicted ATPase/class 3 adenylate cyclase
MTRPSQTSVPKGGPEGGDGFYVSVGREPSAGPSEDAPDLRAERDAQLAAHVPRVALEWLAERPEEQHRRVEGTFVLVDVSGFTALTERLAVRGRAGAEEITEIVGSTFSELARIAGAYGADLLKWGGDASLLLFEGPGSGVRGARAAWLMAGAMGRLGRLRTSAGRVQLQVSVGLHSGVFELFLLGEAFRELVVAGPGASTTAAMQAAASPGEVVVSRAAAAQLPPDVLGRAVGEGILLRGEPEAEESRVPSLPSPYSGNAGLLLAERAKRFLLSGGEQAEHRPVAIGFVQVSGLDALVHGPGPAAAASVLDPLVRSAQLAAERYDVTFHGSDVARDGFKLILLAGVPTLEGNDADRLLRAALEIVQPHSIGAPTPTGGAAALVTTGLSVRAGVNVGKTFVFSSLPLGRRRVHSISGDAVNLAARVVDVAGPGDVLCTEAARAALRSPFVLRPRPPFAAKGKTEPVISYAVTEEGGAAAPPGQEPGAFVGRSEELGILLTTAAKIGAGTPGKFLELVGAAGIGKSRLLDEAVRAWRVATWRVPCDAFGGGRPYRPLRGLARQLLGLDDDVDRSEVAAVLIATLEKSAPALLPWAPLLADVFDVAVPARREVDELEPRFRLRRLESAFVELMALLVDGPAAFVFDDTHALDGASASLVKRIAEETEMRPWLVVCTRRPDAPRAVDSDLPASTLLELGALDQSSSERLVAELADDSFGPRERELLVGRAAGNPLFLLELSRAMRATGSPEALPDSLEPLLAARVDRLSVPDRAVLRAAAVLGLRFEDELLADVVDDPALVDQGVWTRLAEFVRGEPGERAFTHALLRDVAYEGLSFRRRRELHARAGDALEARAQGGELPVEELSLHWLAAERWDRAWDCARLAGENAAALYANADAAAHLTRALEAARHLRALPAADVARVGEQLGDVAELTGAYGRARSAYDAARSRVASGVDRARLLRKIGVLHERRGRYSQALRCYTGALGRLGSDGAGVSVERCELLLAKAGVLHREWRLRDSAAAAQVAGEVATTALYRRGLAHSLYLRHINSVYLNHPEDDLAQEALDIFVQLGDLVGQGNVLNNLGISAYYRGAWDEALQHYGASRDVRERTGDLIGAATEENNIGEILSDQGHFGEAWSRFKAAAASWRSARYRVGEALVTSNLGRLAARTGRMAEGAELLEQARAVFDAIHAGTYVDETDVRLLECALLAYEFNRVVATGAELATRFAGRAGYETLYVPALRLRGIALARLGDYAEAEPLLDESVVRAWEMGQNFELAQALEARAELWRRLGSSEAAERAASDESHSEVLFARLGVGRRHPGAT